MAHIVKTIVRPNYTVHIASDCYENKTPEEMEAARNDARRVAIRIMERYAQRCAEAGIEPDWG